MRLALGAGIPTVVTVNVYTHDQNFEQALVVVDQLGEPDQPCEVLQGNIGQRTYINNELLKAFMI